MPPMGPPPRICMVMEPFSTFCMLPIMEAPMSRRPRAAVATGQSVLVPKYNERTGKALWDLPEAVLLPSDMTIILDGCHLRQADG